MREALKSITDYFIDFYVTVKKAYCRDFDYVFSRISIVFIIWMSIDSIFKMKVSDVIIRHSNHVLSVILGYIGFFSIFVFFVCVASYFLSEAEGEN